MRASQIFAPVSGPSADSDLAARFLKVRALSEAIAAPLSDADATVQPMDDASPAKWHLAHTTWFFETFLLAPHVPGYQLHDSRYGYLFNSYYEALGPRQPRPRRGMLTRPTLAEIMLWRQAVDRAMREALPDLPAPLVELGLAHEEQHQELMLTDLLFLFAQNPLLPAYAEWLPERVLQAIGPIRWIAGQVGLAEIGHDGAEFAFDCEGPRHGVLLHPHALADRPVTNGEWLGFIADDGYRRPDLWLSAGWDWAIAEGITAPLHWRQTEGEWHGFTLQGLHPLDPAAPVTHISYYEADAYARWAGARLPTEAEWESAAAALDPAEGNLLDDPKKVRPHAAALVNGLAQMFGDVWEWTSSSFAPYPGFRAPADATGEYNAKFMCGQQVLKGGSCATPRGHMRASCRNFFHPHQRWQFTGLRLAKDL